MSTITAFKSTFLSLLLTILLASCSSNPPAPVIDRLPGSANSTKKSSTPKAPSQQAVVMPKTNINRPTYKSGDWRPDTYTVKKGDTLFSIGLEFGYDYKEIAQTNNIPSPYGIQVGQTLKFNQLKDKPSTQNTAGQINGAKTNEDGVTTYPLGANTTITETASASVLAINEPKATREAYSEDALKAPVLVNKPITKSSVEKPTTITAPTKLIPSKTMAEIKETKPEIKTDNKPDSKMEAADDIDWAWPTKGKVIANFNDAGSKGIDIAGSTGQVVEAAAGGKVIYSGSDLRGYGKLVIIKHNNTYLSVYAHNSQILVKEGQQVSRGQKIAEMGNSDTDTVKLHFEIRRQGKSVDPSKYLAANE